jgi:hypothetical protein
MQNIVSQCVILRHELTKLKITLENGEFGLIDASAA